MPSTPYEPISEPIHCDHCGRELTDAEVEDLPRYDPFVEEVYGQECDVVLCDECMAARHDDV